VTATRIWSGSNIAPNSCWEDNVIGPRRTAALALSIVLVVSSAAARAQQIAASAFPSRPIHIVVPFPAGGPADIVARLISRKMSEDWGQAVIIDNRPGANTIIGAQFVARSPPDGYTLLMVIDSTLAMNQFLYRDLPYDPFNDFAPITLTAKTMSLLTVRADRGPKTVRDLIATAKAAPGKLSYGGGTITTQLMGRLFNKAAGVDILYVPFKGTPETTNGLLTGSVDLIYAATTVVLPLTQAGQFRALAKMDSRSLPAVGDLQTVAQATGLTEFDDISVWLGLVAPKGTPKAIIDKINHEVRGILADPTVKQTADASGSYPVTSSPEEFSGFIRREADRWERLIRELNLRYD
jgi:tripartite-type tricarboxylate transporter receptor subunit TctC